MTSFPALQVLQSSPLILGLQKPGFFSEFWAKLQRLSQKPGFFSEFWAKLQRLSQKPGFLVLVRKV